MIPFNRSFVGEREFQNIRVAIEARSLSGDGPFTRDCHAWLRRELGVNFALLTHSATGALEMAALLADLKHGDEVIMPSFTFVSTANAVVLRGAVPVFVDIRADTMNLDEMLIADAVTERTKAIMPVHYAGVACEMDEIMAIADRRRLLVIEDAAQGLMSSYKGRPLGTIGHMGAISFHSTKNISCGEGGAFITRDREVAERAEVIREKGTNRSKFFRGEVDKYSWVETGSSYLPSELNAAYLVAQLDMATWITDARMAIWTRYHAAFEAAEREGVLQRPVIPDGCVHNAHIYYLVLPDLQTRTAFIAQMKARGIGTTFHYVPLHSSPHGPGCSRQGSTMANTDSLSDRMVRLPVWPGLEREIDTVVEHALAIIGSLAR
jgi:dTDP-4-amino-4,6-dideoxygalactose transaminase